MMFLILAHQELVKMQGFLFYIYLGVILLCFILSIKNPLARKKKLWLYFLVIIFVEIYTAYIIKYTHLNIHSYALSFYILYFVNYFLDDLFKKQKFWKYSILILVLILCSLFIFLQKEIYDKNLIFIMITSYVILPLYCLYNLIENVDEISILKKQIFWISISLLIWIIFFSFFIIPVYFLNENDKDFLEITSSIFKYATVFSYVLMIQATRCKY